MCHFEGTHKLVTRKYELPLSCTVATYMKLELDFSLSPLLPTHLYNANTQELNLMASLLLRPHSFVISMANEHIKNCKTVEFV